MKAILFAGLILGAGQAHALSCNFGDAAAAYQEAAQNGLDFRAAIGTLTWSDLTPINTQQGGFVMEYEGQEFDAIARFQGTVMGANGERTPIDQNLRVLAWCANGDCGYASSEWEMLTFLHDTPDGLVMVATPCQSYPRRPDAEAVDAVQQCLDGGPCEGTRFD